jgi:hypothetical protein
MNGPRPPLLVRVAEGWVAWYTRGLPGEVHDARRAELRSDLFEHRRHATAGGHGRLRWSLQVGGRVVRGMPDDLWWRFAQQAASRPRTEASDRRRRLLAWLFDWLISPAAAIGVLLTAWRSTSPFWPAGALVVLFVVLAVLRMKLVGPISNEAAYMFGVAPPDADPGRLRRLWGGLLASVLLLLGVRAYAATLNPMNDMASVASLAGSLASIGILVSVLMLLNEYARRWRRRRRGRSGGPVSP